MVLALLDIYARKYELLPELVRPPGAGPPVAHDDDDSMIRRGQRWFKSIVNRDSKQRKLDTEIPATEPRA
jgi:hypothetical protein